MSERFHVRVTKDYLVFSAGHFITFNGDQCERLHGHNYRMAVEVEGDLDANHYVFDFIALRDRAKEIADELDHRMLLPTGNAHISVAIEGNEVRARFRDRQWLFPREDCVILPIENTTTELLARHIAGRLRDLLASRHGFVPRVLRVEVEENFGQSAIFEWSRMA